MLYLVSLDLIVYSIVLIGCKYLKIYKNTIIFSFECHSSTIVVGYVLLLHMIFILFAKLTLTNILLGIENKLSS